MILKQKKSKPTIDSISFLLDLNNTLFLNDKFYFIFKIISSQTNDRTELERNF